MGTADSLILVASASRDEQLRIEHALMSAGRRVRLVRNRVQAERVCANHGGASILVIDSDLLEAPGDPQWRDLRTRHPALAAVVRCPTARDELQRADHNTLRVHQSNGAAICDALDLLDSYRLGAMPERWTKHRTVSGTEPGVRDRDRTRRTMDG